MADDRAHYGWGRIMQDKDLISALEKLGGVRLGPAPPKEITPRPGLAGFVPPEERDAH